MKYHDTKSFTPPLRKDLYLLFLPNLSFVKVYNFNPYRDKGIPIRNPSFEEYFDENKM